MPSKKLEPLIWEKVKRFATEPDFMRDVFTRVKKQHEENPHQKDREHLKAKIGGITSQIDALSERLSELPKAISAQPIYRRMKKLQMIKEGYENDLVQLDQGGKTSFDRVSEGNAKPSAKEKCRFYQTAYASLRECQTILKMAKVDADNKIHATTDHLGASLWKLVQSKITEIGESELRPRD